MAGTVEAVQALQAQSGHLQKAKEVYHAKCLELDRLRKEGAPLKELEKVSPRGPPSSGHTSVLQSHLPSPSSVPLSPLLPHQAELKSKKAAESFALCIEKHNRVGAEFEQKMSESSLVSHLHFLSLNPTAYESDAFLGPRDARTPTDSRARAHPAPCLDAPSLLWLLLLLPWKSIKPQ